MSVKRALAKRLRTRTSRVLAVCLGLALAGGAVLVPTAFAAEATAKPNFEVPFPCGQTWSGQTRTNHNPQNSIDFNRANDNGDPVSASAAGTVSKVGNTGGTSYGRYVVINHGSGWQTLYAHLSSVSVKTGQKVGVGKVIGKVGTTGGSTGPHLHYEQKHNGSAVKIAFDGKTALYWGTKNYKSSNKCSGGGGNPYTSKQVCGSGYKKIDSAALKKSGKKVGTVVLMYNSANKKNCVVTLKSTNLSKKTKTTAFLEVKNTKRVNDSGSFQYYAGPVSKKAAKTCVKWGGSTGGASFTSGWGHCG